MPCHLHTLCHKGGIAMSDYHTAGRRVDRDHVPFRQQFESSRHSQGKREEEPRPNSRWMRQLLASALLFALLVGVKVAYPDVAEQYSRRARALLSNETDFAAAFSAVGRAVGGEEMGQAINDAYVAVFGPADDAAVPVMANDRTALAYTEDNIPPQAELLQSVLGFDYADPVDGTLSSAFGYRAHPIGGDQRFHYGLDIAAESSAIIRSFADGTVLAVGESSDLGKYVEVAHANGYTTLYAHCSKITASSGQSVRLGDPIAEVGESGETTGPHLHFEIHRDTQYLNPIYYVTY